MTEQQQAELDDAVARAVQEERVRIHGVIRAHMDRVKGHYEDGADDTPRKRAYALGQMGALHLISLQLGGGTIPVSPTMWYSRDCERLDV